MQATLRSSLSASLCLPAKAVSRRTQAVQQLRCSATKQQQQQQREASPLDLKYALALMTSGALAAPTAALAEEAEAAAGAAADAAPAAGIFGLTPLGVALVLSPVIFYGVFNIYRTTLNPRANFGDAVFAFAALIILGNIFSIVVFKVRLF